MPSPAHLFMISDPFSYGQPNPGSDRSALTEPDSSPSGLNLTTCQSLISCPLPLCARSVWWPRTGLFHCVYKDWGHFNFYFVNQEDHFNCCLGIVDASVCAFLFVLFTQWDKMVLHSCASSNRVGLCPHSWQNVNIQAYWGEFWGISFNNNWTC